MAVAVKNDFDAIVIGGGFYGTIISIYLSQHKKLNNILILEHENELMQRSSLINQARVHNGYHYPRSFSTAYRSRVNFPKFVSAWGKAIKKDFNNVYAVARKNSKVSPYQFEKFCNEIGAKIKKANKNIANLFNENLISSVYETEEYVFDINEIRFWAKKELEKSNIKTMFNTHAESIFKQSKSKLILKVKRNGYEKILSSRYIFNCTYSGINQINTDPTKLKVILKHEIAEIALIRAPSIMNDFGVTVIDGPFFSFMPFPSLNSHSLTHVRYTPHHSWEDSSNIDPYKALNMYKKISHYDRMVRDASRYLPDIKTSKYIDSIYEVKTVLVANENNDGRPILFEKSEKIPGLYSVLGGKIDNIFDVIEKLNNENIR